MRTRTVSSAIRWHRNVCAFALAIGLACSSRSPQEPDATKSADRHRELIVVIHGFGPTEGLCEPLAEKLAAEGYSTLVFEYESTLTSVGTGRDALLELFDELDSDRSIPRFHLVTHSMGGIVTRAALAESRPRKLGRIVMIAPPNRGSPVADFFAPLFSWCLPPLAELGTDASCLVNRLPAIEAVDVGILAGANDWTVPAPYTRLDGATDLIVLEDRGFASTHNGLILTNDETERQVLTFLQRGAFDHATLR